jgi:hypothetical protein
MNNEVKMFIVGTLIFAGTFAVVDALSKFSKSTFKTYKTQFKKKGKLSTAFYFWMSVLLIYIFVRVIALLL